MIDDYDCEMRIEPYGACVFTLVISSCVFTLVCSLCVIADRFSPDGLMGKYGVLRTFFIWRPIKACASFFHEACKKKLSHALTSDN